MQIQASEELTEMDKIAFFLKLKDAVQNDLDALGCSAHILHNCTFSTAANTFSFDAKMVIFKIF